MYVEFTVHDLGLCYFQWKLLLCSMLTVVAMAMADLGSGSPSSDIELAGSASVDLEPANVTTSSGQRSR